MHTSLAWVRAVAKAWHRPDVQWKDFVQRILWIVVQKHSYPPQIPTAAGPELAGAVAVGNVTNHSVMYSVEIVKPAKNMPQEKEKKL